MSLGGTRVQDQDLDLGGMRVFNPRAPVASTDLVRLQDLPAIADPNGWYVVTKAANAPANSTNLGAMASGLVRSTVSGASSTLSIDTSTYLTTTLAASTYQPVLSPADTTISLPTAGTIKVDRLSNAFIAKGTADAQLTGAFFLGSLTTGLLKVAATTGNLTTGVANTDFADPAAFYVVTKAAGAPANASNLGALGTGLVKSTVAGAVSTLSIDSSTYLTTTLAGSTYQPLLTSASGANLTSKFILQGTADAGATNAQFLGALPTGLLKNTTTTGVLTGATANTDFPHPGAFYVVTQSTNAPSNAANLGGLATGIAQLTTSGAVATLSSFAAGNGQIPFGDGTGKFTQTSNFAYDSSGILQMLLPPAGGSAAQEFVRLTLNDTGNFFRQSRITSYSYLSLSGSVPSSSILMGADFRIVTMNSSSGLFSVRGSTNSSTASSAVIQAYTIDGDVALGFGGMVSAATSGFLFVTSMPLGPPTAVPTRAFLGTAIVPDTLNGRLYAYMNSTWSYAAFDNGAALAGHVITTQADSAFANSTNLGGLAGGVLQSSVSGAVATVSTKAITAGQVVVGGGIVSGGITSDSHMTYNSTSHVLSVDGVSTAAITMTSFIGVGGGAGLVGFNTSTGAFQADTTAYLSHAYVTIESAGSSATARSQLNFLSDFLVADNSGNASTDVSLATQTGVAGTYTNLNATINSKGVITAASNGTGGGSGADPLGFYVVTKSTNAPVNGINLGGLSSGFVFSTVSGAVSTLSIVSAYTTVQQAGTPVTQRSTVNFTAQFSASDVGGKTQVDLAGGFTVGTVSYPTMTVDTYGRVVSIVSNPTPQPALSLTAGSVLVSSGGTGVTQDNANFNYNTSTHQLGLGGAVTIGGTTGVGSIGEAIAFNRAGDQAITKTGGVLYVATTDAHTITFITNGSSRGGFGTTGILTVNDSITTPLLYGVSSDLLLQNTSGFTPDTFIELTNSAITTKGHLLPTTNRAYHLGSAIHIWEEAYVTFAFMKQIDAGVDSLHLAGQDVRIGTSPGGDIQFNLGAGGHVAWGDVQGPGSTPITPPSFAPAGTQSTVQGWINVKVNFGAGDVVGIVPVYTP